MLTARDECELCPFCKTFHLKKGEVPDRQACAQRREFEALAENLFNKYFITEVLVKYH